MKHFFTVTSGDWSQDGHNLFDRYLVKSNRSPKQVVAAHKAACSNLDIDWDSLCREYEDNDISEIYPTLESNNLLDFEFDDFEGYYEISSFGFMQLYFLLAKFSDPDLVYEIQDPFENDNDIKIGGYGTYSD